MSAVIRKLITIPLRTVMVLTEKIREEVDKEIYSVPYIQQQLLLLYTRYEIQEVGEDEFVKREEELLSRLESAKELEWEQLSSDDANNE